MHYKISQQFKKNIKGLKSKVDSVQELVDGCQLKLLCLIQTHIQEEETTISGYKTIYQNDKTSMEEYQQQSKTLWMLKIRSRNRKGSKTSNKVR